MADIVIIEPVQSGPAPLAYNLADRQPLEVLAVHADYDGTGAGGSFKPAVSFYAPDGKKLGTFTADTITAGSTGSVTWFPFAPPSSAGGTTDPLAVHFNTSPQSNTFLTTTTATGTSFTNSGAGQVNIESDDGAGGGGFVGITTAGGEVFLGSTTTVVKLNPAGGNFEVRDHSNALLYQIQEGGFQIVTLRGGTQLEIDDNTTAPIFEVRNDGSIHGRAAVGAITWDL